MSILDYVGSQRIAAEVSRLSAGNEFISLMMAAMRYAGSDEIFLLRSSFPTIYHELIQRRDAPGGALNEAEMAWVSRRYEREVE